MRLQRARWAAFTTWAVLGTGCSAGALVADATDPTHEDGSPLDEHGHAAALVSSRLERIAARVQSNNDGDTLRVQLASDGRRTRVRLLFVDTPESASRDREGQGPWASAATDALRELLPVGTRVTLETPGADIHGRYLARVLRDEGPLGPSLDVNREMLRRGAAFPLLFCRPDVPCARADIERAGGKALRAACEEAQSKRRGVFSENGLTEQPFEFRDRAWGQPEIVWVGDLETYLYYPFERRHEVPVCRQVVFALRSSSGRAEPWRPAPTESGHPEYAGFTPAP
jgi:endonuclease YncB( thermonuclease family)